MKTTVQTLRAILSACRPARATMALGLLLTLGFANSGLAQTTPPLNFGNNFFVTGDYVVAGAYGMNQTVVNNLTTGTITVPDANPGITGARSVPTGAQIVAAFLYWETVENVGAPLGQPGSGQMGSLKIGNGQTYPIQGEQLPSQSTVSWSNGGCPGSSTGRVVRVYRADVMGLLPVDENGNVLAGSTSSPQTYQITLPSSSNGSPPITLGASLVIIYRVLSKDIPLNSIVIYDGAYGQTSGQLTMTQYIQGFYDAAPDDTRVTRLTHIVGSGQNNKFQTVYLGTALDNLVPLPNLYGGQAYFPGWYGRWDNPTWTFDKNSTNPANPVTADSAQAITQVVPSTSQQGCGVWGAIILSTTVNQPDGDGLLKAWKSNQGYCDAAITSQTNPPAACGGSSDPSWVDLTGATLGDQDIFVQLDYMCQNKQVGTNACSSGYSFDPRLTTAPDGDDVIKEVKEAFADQYADAKPRHQPINLHVSPTWAIQEQTCNDATNNNVLCFFPNQAGVVGWRGGFSFIQNQLLKNDGSGDLCTDGATCMPRFQHGKKDSWHYVLFAHALGQSKWGFFTGLTDSTGTATPPNGVVSQNGTTVTFYTATAHGLIVSNTAGNGRVTISDAISNPNLNGTFLVTNTVCPTNTNTNPPTLNDCRVTNTAPGPYRFDVTIGTGAGAQPSYTYQTNANLSVTPGNAGTGSGISDIGGPGSLVTLGNWIPADVTWNVKAGIFMHEFGHSLGLTHGGLYYDHLSSPPNADPTLNDYRPTAEPNCKPNFLSIMSYAFAIDLLDNANLDYSEELLPTLNEPVGPSTSFVSSFYADTSWYAPTDAAHASARHCDGSPILDGAQMKRLFDLTTNLSWTPPQDINFDGDSHGNFRGHSDWTATSTSPGLDLRQTSGVGTLAVGPSGPGNLPGGPGNLPGGPGTLPGGPGNLPGGPGNLPGGPGNLPGGPGELSHETLCSYARSPLLASASEGVSPRTITVSWNAPIACAPVNYKVYRSVNGGDFTVIATVSGNTTSYVDPVSCNTGGYRYYVTSVIQDDITNKPIESQPSNTTSNSPLLTGCYTNTPSTVVLNDLAFSSNTATKASVVNVTWSLKDDDTGAQVTRAQANTALSAIGPIPYDGVCPASPPPNATVTQVSTSGSGITNQFSFGWNTTNFNAGCYFFKLNLDSGQSEVATSALSLLIWLSDSAFPTLTTTLPNAVYNKSYSNQLFQAGGTAPFTWTVGSGALPPGILLGSSTGIISGKPTATGSFTFGVKVTDTNKNYGTQTFTLAVCKPSGC